MFNYAIYRDIAFKSFLFKMNFRIVWLNTAIQGRWRNTHLRCNLPHCGILGVVIIMFRESCIRCRSHYSTFVAVVLVRRPSEYFGLGYMPVFAGALSVIKVVNCINVCGVISRRRRATRYVRFTGTGAIAIAIAIAIFARVFNRIIPAKVYSGIRDGDWRRNHQILAPDQSRVKV